MRCTPLGLAALLAASCTGSIPGQDETPDGKDDNPAMMRPDSRTPGTPAPTTAVTKPTAPIAQAAPARVRRLTASEVRASLSDVWLGGLALSGEFPRESQRRAFDNRYDNLSVALPVAESLQGTAEVVADRFTTNMAKLFPCDAAKGEAACVDQLLATFGRRTFRRPLTDAEKTRYTALFTNARKSVDYPRAIGAVVQALVQSPNFLFRTEQGDTAAKPGKVVPLTAFELGSALSYFVWGSAPDDALLDAAGSGKLGTIGEVEAQTRRMLADPRARRGMTDFFQQWLGVSHSDALAKNTKSYPMWTPGLMQAAVAETGKFWESVVFGAEPTLAALLTSSSTFVNGDLAKLYGVTGPKGSALEAATVDPKRRAGFLSQPAFMAANTPAAVSSPIYLGLFVRAKLLCQRIPDPPADVPPAPEPDANASTRIRFAQHEANPSCAACHRFIDPIGFGFEQLDNVGRFREIEDGKFPLTGEGHLENTDVDGKFVGVAELAAKLAKSGQVEECFAANVLEFALGRETTAPEARLAVDDATLQAMRAAVAGKKGDLKELFVSAATADAFRFRDTTALSGGTR